MRLNTFIILACIALGGAHQGKAAGDDSDPAIAGITPSRLYAHATKGSAAGSAVFGKFRKRSLTEDEEKTAAAQPASGSSGGEKTHYNFLTARMERGGSGGHRKSSYTSSRRASVDPWKSNYETANDLYRTELARSNTLEKNYFSLEDELRRLESEYTTLNTKYKDLSARYGDLLESEITRMKSKNSGATSLKGQVSGLQNKIRELETEISNARTQNEKDKNGFRAALKEAVRDQNECVNYYKQFVFDWQQVDRSLAECKQEVQSRGGRSSSYWSSAQTTLRKRGQEPPPFLPYGRIINEDTLELSHEKSKRASWGADPGPFTRTYVAPSQRQKQ